MPSNDNIKKISDKINTAMTITKMLVQLHPDIAELSTVNDLLTSAKDELGKVKAAPANSSSIIDVFDDVADPFEAYDKASKPSAKAAIKMSDVDPFAGMPTASKAAGDPFNHVSVQPNRTSPASADEAAARNMFGGGSSRKPKPAASATGLSDPTGAFVDAAPVSRSSTDMFKNVDVLPPKKKKPKPSSSPAPQQAAQTQAAVSQQGIYKYIPMLVEELDITPYNEISSMYVQCRDKNIKEWDVGDILITFDRILGFSLHGTLSYDGEECTLNWSKATQELTADVSAFREQGALMERANQLYDEIPFDIYEREDDNIYTEIVEVQSIRDAMEILPFMEIDVASIVMDFSDFTEKLRTEFTIYFKTGVPDLEISWMHSQYVTRAHLAHFIQFLALEFDFAASTEDTGVPSYHDIERMPTKAGYYHFHKTRYTIDLAQANNKGIVKLGISGIEVKENGDTSIREFDPRTVG